MSNGSDPASDKWLICSYDPDFGHLDWGKVSALYEIDLALEGRYEYYYMGFYIHSCIKMRYKGKYSPSYLLDPESLDWHLLDDAHREKLDRRKYVSLSGDSKAGKNESDVEPNGHVKSPPAASGEGQQDTTKERSAKFADDQDLEFEDADSEEEDAEIPEGSLFDYNIPGVLSKDEVAKLDLDHWKLMVRNSLVDLEDLRGWDQWQLDDSNSIKGIAAELIAATGPQLLQNSAVNLFG